MTTDAALAYVSEKIDIYSLIDWVVCRSYMDDGDITNIRFYMSEEADGKWRWCYFDLDWAFWTDRTDCINNVVVNGPNSTLMKLLMTNPVFRDMFIRRYAELMGSILNERAVMERIDWFVSVMEPEIAENQARYGMTVERWYEWLEKMRAIVRDGRRNITVLKDIKAYFGLSDAQMDEYFGALGYDIYATPVPETPTPTLPPEQTPTLPPEQTPTLPPEPSSTQLPEPSPTQLPEPSSTQLPEPSPTPADTPLEPSEPPPTPADTPLEPSSPSPTFPPEQTPTLPPEQTPTLPPEPSPTQLPEPSPTPADTPIEPSEP
jgi:hypothetical protein